MDPIILELILLNGRNAHFPLGSKVSYHQVGICFAIVVDAIVVDVLLTRADTLL